VFPGRWYNFRVAAGLRVEKPPSDYNEFVTPVLKSVAAGLVGAALFFCFFMMFSIPVLTVMAKLHDPNAPLEAPGVVVAPARLFRTVGVPLSAVAFAVCFVLAMRREHRVIRRSGDRVI
jgi:hypothetical protein